MQHIIDGVKEIFPASPVEGKIRGQICGGLNLSSGSAKTIVHMSGESILIVEDEGLIALHLFELLESAGYRITGTAYSGEVALRDIGKAPLPDLILMDIALAGAIDGVETARRIRQQFDIPIVYLTAYSNQNRIDEATTVSPYGYLKKPVMKDDLLETIRRALDRKARSS